MAIRTPDILPGEPGYISKKERTAKKKVTERKKHTKARAKSKIIGKIKAGSKGFRIGRPITTPRKEQKYPLWKFKRKIGEIIVSNKDSSEEKISMKFFRFGGIGNFKHLIQDADFQKRWSKKEKELLDSQKACKLCGKKISKTAIPNLYHYNLFKKRASLLEEAEKVPNNVISGKFTVKKGWEKFNHLLEEGNRYYMSLKETALICSTCAKSKGLVY